MEHILSTLIQACVQQFTRRIQSDFDGAVTAERGARTFKHAGNGRSCEQADFQSAHSFVSVVGMNARRRGGIQTCQHAVYAARPFEFALLEPSAQSIVARRSW